MNWKQLSVALRLVISAVLIIWLLRMADSAALSMRLAGADLLAIGLLALMTNVDRVLMALKWDMLLRVRGIRQPVLASIGVYYRCSFYGIFLPTVGADAMRIVEMSRRTGRPAEIVSSVLIERAIGLIAVAVTGLAGLAVVVPRLGERGWQLLWALIALVSIAVVVFGLTLSRRWLAGLHTRLASARWKPLRKAGQILEAYQQHAGHRATLLLFLILSIIEQFIPVLTAWLTARALHLSIDLAYFLVFIPIITAIVRLPISFDGFGVREGLFVTFFGLVGVAPGDAFLVGLLSSLLWRLATAPPILFFFWADRADAPQPAERRIK